MSIVSRSSSEANKLPFDETELYMVRFEVWLILSDFRLLLWCGVLLAFFRKPSLAFNFLTDEGGVDEISLFSDVFSFLFLFIFRWRFGVWICAAVRTVFLVISCGR